MNALVQELGKNPFVLIWGSYIAGVGMSLTPCVYPLIPVVVGVVGGQDTGRLRSFFLSLIYVCSMAITYAVLGIIAALGGRFFGFTYTSPWVNLIVGIVLLIFGLAMIDLIIIKWKPALKGLKKFENKWFGVGFIGLISGFVAAPCSTPVLGSILTYTATTGNIVFSGILLFVYGLGVGTLLIIAGTFAGILSVLPRPGKWMVIIKRIFGTILILSGIFFLYRAITFF